MSQINVFVDQDRIHNPFIEVVITFLGDYDDKFETKKAIKLAKESQPRVDKICLKKSNGITQELLFKTWNGEKFGWSRSHRENGFGKSVWVSCEELGVEE